MIGRAYKLVTLAVAVMAGLVFVTGAAFAASGGGFSSQQQDCPGNADAYNTPPGSVPPGCHNTSANVETADMANGDPSPNNTRFAEFGIDQLPNDPHNPSFGAEENIGDPGTPDSPHSGCFAVNTDGTGGGTGTGCGDNPHGLGLSGTYDYYQLYCPLAAMLSSASTPDANGQLPALYKCASDQPIGKNTVTPDLGAQSALDTIVTHGVLVYLGAFDNLDNGEHDGFSGLNGSDGAINGPSDGGADVVSITPQTATATPTPSNPEGLVNESLGACADGICLGASSQQQSVYQGCNASVPDNNATNDRCAPGVAKNDNVYENNTPSSTKASSNCNAGDAKSEQACSTNADGSPNPGGANAYRQHTPQNNNVEPGIQTYQDPDPQRSPALPVGTPGLYVGTCGVYVGDSGGYGLPGVVGLLSGGALSANPGYVGGVSNC